MSDWVKFRDSVVDALHVDDVTEDVKQKVTATILAQVLPVISEAVDGFTAATREQAKTETGWCKIRDGIVLPYVLKAIMYIGKQALERTLANTVKEA